MFLYGGVMLVVAFIFAVMSYFYTYSDFSGNAIPVEAIDDEQTEMKEKEMKNGDDSTTHL